MVGNPILPAVKKLKEFQFLPGKADPPTHQPQRGCALPFRRNRPGENEDSWKARCQFFEGVEPLNRIESNRIADHRVPSPLRGERVTVRGGRLTNLNLVVH